MKKLKQIQSSQSLIDSVWSDHLDKTQNILTMEQTLENYEFGLDWEILKKKTDNVMKSDKCNLCDYASSQADFSRHLKTHSGEKPKKCNQCDYASFKAINLRRHLKTHSGEKSNKCNQCNYASSEAGFLRKQASHLRRHLKTHSGEKPKKCN